MSWLNKPHTFHKASNTYMGCSFPIVASRQVDKDTYEGTLDLERMEPFQKFRALAYKDVRPVFNIKGVTV